LLKKVAQPPQIGTGSEQGNIRGTQFCFGAGTGNLFEFILRVRQREVKLPTELPHTIGTLDLELATESMKILLTDSQSSIGLEFSAARRVERVGLENGSFLKRARAEYDRL
jgi:hypothetical protein